MKTTPAPANPRGSSSRTRRLRAALRTAATLAIADGVLQAMLAGRFLAGNFDALGLHGTNTSVLAALTITLLGITIAWCRSERGPWWPAITALALVGAEGAQVWFAQLNLLELHVPLGVAIIATLALITAWAWQTAGVSDEPPNSGTTPTTPPTTVLRPNPAGSARSSAPSARGTAEPDRGTAGSAPGTTGSTRNPAESAWGTADSAPGRAGSARSAAR